MRTMSATRTAPSTPHSGDTYALGRTSAETRRLILQNQIYGTLTRRLFVDAGIGPGMRVLDLGSGAGDVSLVLADLVGPQGQVVGVDQNAAILDTARARVASAGFSTVEFRHGDIQAIEDFDFFDAIVGRWVLMYLPDPVRTIQQVVEHLRPGGVVAFQESDLSKPARPFPAGPLHHRIGALMTPPGGGPDLEMGPKLFQTFVRAGLRAPQVRVESPAGGGQTWPGYTYVAETMRSLLPFLERLGITSGDEIGVDTLADRLRDEITAVDGIQILPPLVSAWTRR